MANIQKDPTSEIENLVDFAEVISEKIDEIRNNLEKTRTKLHIFGIAAIIGIPTGFIISSGIQGIMAVDIDKSISLITGGSFLLLSFSIMIATVLNTLNRIKYLNRELKREQHTLASLVNLIDIELQEASEYLSMSQRALLEMRLRRISFQ